MKTFIVIMCSILGLCVSAVAQYRKENISLAKADATRDQLKYDKLQLYPIRANNSFKQETGKISRYVPLKNALDSKKVLISEKGSSGNVNTLFIENISKDTIIVLSGEVIKGGQQDRVIAQDFVLYPKSGKKDVSVFCVEHGRWTSRDGDRSFREYYAISPNKVRKAATVNKNQSEVWSEVAEATSKNKAETNTGTLTALENSDTLNVRAKQYAAHFQKGLADDPQVIGVVAVTGKTILGCDMFVSHEMFVNYLPALLNSYATEALTSGEIVNVTYEEVEKYLDTIIEDEAKQDKEVEKKGAILKDGNKKIHITTF